MASLARISLTAWEKINDDIEPEEAMCPKCWGRGMSVCTCCGEETDCKICKGKGNVPSREKAYKKQIKIEDELLKLWNLEVVEATDP